jgi:hypothetical protein
MKEFILTANYSGIERDTGELDQAKIPLDELQG